MTKEANTAEISAFLSVKTLRQTAFCQFKQKLVAPSDALAVVVGGFS
jgi:hypothetical protein